MVGRDGVSQGEQDEIRRSHVPLRTCIGCRARRPRQELVRLALHEGRVVADPGGRLGGRGAWLCPDPACVDKAARRRAFERGWRGSTLPPDLDLLRRLVAAER
ncbi:MAG: YlxR family protein [Deltaproteobacteria bacterium]|nr:YlxR family protein [Deltaproteobacteria bacterium]